MYDSTGGAYHPTGCGNTFTFSGCSGIATEISGNTLKICYTGTGSGAGEINCSGFSGFYDSTGGSYEASGCDDTFTFSGCSGIATEISGNILKICYTGTNCSGFSGFYDSTGGSYEASGCDDTFTFSGCSGIATEISDNILKICYTGTGSGAGEINCSGFSGFYDSIGGSYQASGCDDTFTFIGCSGIATEISDNILKICYTGTGSGAGEINCSGFSGFYDSTGGSYQASGCDDVFTFSGCSGIATEISGNILKSATRAPVRAQEKSIAAVSLVFTTQRAAPIKLQDATTFLHLVAVAASLPRSQATF